MVKRVLIVDDHEPFRAIARELLEAAGYVVSGEAADGAEALAAVAAGA
jgi:CheY-like chemotaxis protein